MKNLLNTLVELYKKFIAMIKFCICKIKKIAKVSYKILSVISTVSISFGVILFVIGQLTKNNESDNNLIMQQIQAQLAKDSSISDMKIADIHGFGNNSILVTADNTSCKTYLGRDNNRFLILDSLENSNLKNMNDFLGFKSSYKTVFSYQISNSEGAGLCPVIGFVQDIFGDSAREIGVYYEVSGSTFGAYYVAIFKYSYSKEKYELVGTYPVPQKEDIQFSKEFSTKFNKTENCDDYDYYSVNGTDGHSHNLTMYSVYRQAYLGIMDSGKALLFTVEAERDKKAFINSYQPEWDNETNELTWNLIYSDYIDKPHDLISEEVIKNFYKEKYNSTISWVANKIH